MKKQITEKLIQKRVIVVDDHILFRDGLATLINSAEEYKVVGKAGNIMEAIGVAKSTSPDIIIVDFSPPDGNVTDATRAILSAVPGCEVVFLTGQKNDPDHAAAVRAGAKGYLYKYVSGSELISGLKALNNSEIPLIR